MRMLLRLLPWLRPGSRVLRLQAQDCPHCWKARAHAGIWGRGVCRACKKAHRPDHAERGAPVLRTGQYRP